MRVYWCTMSKQSGEECKVDPNPSALTLNPKPCL